MGGLGCYAHGCYTNIIVDNLYLPVLTVKHEPGKQGKITHEKNTLCSGQF